MKNLISKQTGAGIVEVLVAIAIIAIAISALAGLGNFILKLSTQAKDNAAAANLAAEGLETARSLKEESWAQLSSLTTGEPYHPDLVNGTYGPKWSMADGAQALGRFTRQISFYPVNRGASDDIVESGGINDPDTKKVVSTVSWSENNQNYQISVSSYLTNWK